MPSKNVLFFSANQDVVDGHCETDSPLDIVRKSIEAQLSYNQGLITQAMKSSHQELVDLMLSEFVNLDELPRLKEPNERFSKIPQKALLKTVITAAVKNIKNLQGMQALAMENRLDHLYLSIFFSYKELRNCVNDALNDNMIETMLGLYFPPEIAKKKNKQFMKNISKTPLLDEANELAVLLNTLEPEISAHCHRYINEIKIDALGASLTAIKADNNKLNNRLSKIRHLRHQYPSAVELQNLCMAYEFGVSNLGRIKTSDPGEYLLVVFDNFKPLYELEFTIKKLVHNLIMLNSQVETPLVSPPTPYKSIPVKRSTPKNPNKLMHSTATHCPVVDMPSVEPNKTINENEITQNAAINDSVVENLPSSLPNEIAEQKTEETIVEYREKDESENYTDGHFYQPYYKKDFRLKKSAIVAQTNILSLKGEVKDTFLQLFGLMPYDSMSLRSLVNLTYQFKGKMTTTGNNRCRIELENIYAYVTTPKEALTRACSTSTVTMHGGGHRSKKSLNNDRDKAPDYLVNQFKNAFIRAGLTPANLGLDMETPSASINPCN